MDPVVQWILGLSFAAVIAVGGGFIKYLLSLIKGHKQETWDEIEKHKEQTADAVERLRIDTEARRNETRDLLLQLINAKFDAIKESISNLKDTLR